MKHQHGVALILALLVVALAATAAVALTSDQQLSLRRGGNLIARDQALQYAIGAEAWGQLWLKRDFNENKFDHTNEKWAIELPPLPVEGGVIVAQLYDLQGRFNLNNLLDTKGQIDKTQLERLKNLLAVVDIPVTLSESVSDWLDNDFNATGSGGAEDDYYLNLENAYRNANQPMATPTEFRLQREVTTEMLANLRPQTQLEQDPRWIITTLPGFTDINVNTAPVEVLRAIGLDQSTAELVVTQRDGTEDQPDSGKPFEEINDFLGIPAVTQANINPVGLSVISQFFLLTTQAKIARSQAVLYSIIYRDDKGETYVISRSYGTL